MNVEVVACYGPYTRVGVTREFAQAGPRPLRTTTFGKKEIVDQTKAVEVMKLLAALRNYRRRVETRSSPCTGVCGREKSFSCNSRYKGRSPLTAMKPPPAAFATKPRGGRKKPITATTVSPSTGCDVPGTAGYLRAERSNTSGWTRHRSAATALLRSPREPWERPVASRRSPTCPDLQEKIRMSQRRKFLIAGATAATGISLANPSLAMATHLLGKPETAAPDVPASLLDSRRPAHGARARGHRTLRCIDRHLPGVRVAACVDRGSARSPSAR